MDSLGHSVTSITMMLLIIAGAGAFKQVLVDSGISDHIAGLLSKSSLVSITPRMDNFSGIANLCRISNSCRINNSRNSTSFSDKWYGK